VRESDPGSAPANSLLDYCFEIEGRAGDAAALDFSRADATLSASSGSATSMIFLRTFTGWSVTHISSSSQRAAGAQVMPAASGRAGGAASSVTRNGRASG
jgi:hypothetical protein